MNHLTSQQVYLASCSPQRALLLSQLGVKFETLSVEIDEIPCTNEKVEAYVSRLALNKANSGRAISKDHLIPVLGSDTAICIDNTIFGKPIDQNDAKRMMRLLSGKTHRVLTSVALVAPHYQQQILQTSFVSMREILDNEIDQYWQTGEPRDKAAGYAIQAGAAKFISHLEGSYSGVMGLPIFETAKLLDDYFASE